MCDFDRRLPVNYSFRDDVVYNVVRHFNNEKDTHPIFSQDEADQAGLQYVYWKDAEPGQWALTDDGYVMKCVYVDSIGKMRFTGGASFPRDKAEINFLENHDVGVYTAQTPEPYMVKEARTTRAKIFIREVAKFLARNTAYDDMPWEMLGRLYRPNETDPALTAKKLYHNSTIRDKVAEELRNELAKQGLDKERVAREWVELLDEAKDADDLTNIRLTLKEITERVSEEEDHVPKRLTARRTQEKIEGDIMKEEQEVTAER